MHVIWCVKDFFNIGDYYIMKYIFMFFFVLFLSCNNSTEPNFDEFPILLKVNMAEMETIETKNDTINISYIGGLSIDGSVVISFIEIHYQNISFNNTLIFESKQGDILTYVNDKYKLLYKIILLECNYNYIRIKRIR